VRFLIHDHDGKFPESFDEHFVRPKGGVVKTPVMAPIANCFAESWIGSLKRECLNFFLCFSLRQLDHIVQAYACYHNEHRSHQALGNRPLGVSEDPPPVAETEAATIRRRRWLGGLLSHYYREAA
jgi:putative transposase